MKIVSTNLGKKTAVKWRFKTIYTGIFKSAVSDPIFLDLEDVQSDQVVDRKYHGGIDKACYLFGQNAYPYWQALYPKQNLTPGWFGENLTVSDLNESEIRIGNQYQIGEAIVEVSQPREPCFKLGIRFESQKVVKQFIKHHHPGIYIRIIKPGQVTKGDEIILIKERPDEPTVFEIYQLIYGLTKDESVVQKALNSKHLAASAMKIMRKKYG